MKNNNKGHINSLTDSAFNNLAWANMKQILDKEMPVKKENKGFILWLIPAALLLFISIGMLYTTLTDDSGQVAQTTVNQKTPPTDEATLVTDAPVDSLDEQLFADEFVGNAGESSEEDSSSEESSYDTEEEVEEVPQKPKRPRRPKVKAAFSSSSSNSGNSNDVDYSSSNNIADSYTANSASTIDATSQEADENEFNELAASESLGEQKHINSVVNATNAVESNEEIASSESVSTTIDAVAAPLSSDEVEEVDSSTEEENWTSEDEVVTRSVSPVPVPAGMNDEEREETEIAEEVEAVVEEEAEEAGTEMEDEATEVEYPDSSLSQSEVEITSDNETEMEDMNEEGLEKASDEVEEIVVDIEPVPVVELGAEEEEEEGTEDVDIFGDAARAEMEEETEIEGMEESDPELKEKASSLSTINEEKKEVDLEMESSEEGELAPSSATKPFQLGLMAFGKTNLSGFVEAGGGLDFGLRLGSRFMVRTTPSYSVQFSDVYPSISLGAATEDIFTPGMGVDSTLTQDAYLLSNYERAHFFQLPLSLSYVFNRPWEVFAGGDARFLFLTVKKEENLATANAFDFTYVKEMPSKNRFSYGAHVGFRVYPISKLGIDFRYEQGLNDIFIGGSNLNYRLRLGLTYRFIH